MGLEFFGRKGKPYDNGRVDELDNGLAIVRGSNFEEVYFEAGPIIELDQFGGIIFEEEIDGASAIDRGGVSQCKPPTIRRRRKFSIGIGLILMMTYPNMKKLKRWM